MPTGGIELVNGVRKSVTTRLAMWNNPRIAAATEDSDFDLRQLRYREMSVYVGISPDNIERLKPLLVLFFRKRQLIATFPAGWATVQADGHGPGNNFADR